VALKGAGISPYMGDVFHETPLALAIFQLLVPWGHVIAGLFFITLDLLVGYALAQAARLHHQLELQKQAINRKSYGKGVEPILIPRDDSLPSTVAAAYLLNPYTILSCCAYSTISLNHLSIAISLWMALKGNWFLCSLGLSLAVSFSLYPVMLILPLSLLAYKVVSHALTVGRLKI
jgi:phosphatidylinositol glycan class U